jgi:hypothetical protein
MNTTTVQTAAMKSIETEEAVRRLCLGMLIAWGLLATTALAFNASGGWALWLISPFALFGTGLGLVIVGFWSTETAYRLAVAAGGGLAGVTVISQLLMLAGIFDPAAVVGVETGVVALLWLIWERATWTT